MKMREWINLAEAAEMVGDPSYRVLRNPTANALANFVAQSRDRILKGLYEPSTGTLYVWDAFYAAHATAEYDLSLRYAGKGKNVVSLIIGLNDDGHLALHVCDDRAIERVRSHPSFRGIDFAIPDSALHRRWQ
jgi:hypothetical protein